VHQKTSSAWNARPSSANSSPLAPRLQMFALLCTSMPFSVSSLVRMSLAALHITSKAQRVRPLHTT
jgi:hypothetical protein